MIREESKIHQMLTPAQVRPWKGFDAKDYEALPTLGINVDAYVHAMDDLQPTVTVASIGTPVQFLQNWLPGFVEIITAARKIDTILGLATIGSWEDEQIVQGQMELTGTSVPYSDYGNIPFSSWNVNFVERTVVRFEEGLLVGALEEARAARMRVDSGSSKRRSAALALEIVRNATGFYGYNSGNNNTYGLLNDPALPNYTTFPAGASTSTLWSRKTFLEINADIRVMAATLQTQSQDQIDPENEPTTLVLATAVAQYLTVTSDFGISVREWMRQAYPKMRVVSCPEFGLAVGGLNACYLFADKMLDDSTDGGATFIQVVPAKFQVLGIEKKAKAYLESYTNATAGVMCKRPFAVVRYDGN